MLGTNFYNEAIKKTVVGFGTLFNGITVKNVDRSTGDVLSEQRVPVQYGPKEKFITRLEENPELRKVSITYPRIYFEMTGVNYDGTRKTSPVQKYKSVIADNGNEVSMQYVPVPYKVDFELGILSRNHDDGLQILEQILPYFQPNFNITINFIPDMNEKRDVRIQLTSINYSDEWDDNFEERRMLNWTINFEAMTYIYGPYNRGDIIRKAIIYETLSDLNVNERKTELQYTPRALTDLNNDGNIEGVGDPPGPDDLLLTADDDFGFSGSITNF